jgi:hypothetical protein
MPDGPLWAIPGKNQILPDSTELLDEDVDALLNPPPESARVAEAQQREMPQLRPVGAHPKSMATGDFMPWLHSTPKPEETPAPSSPEAQPGRSNAAPESSLPSPLPTPPPAKPHAGADDETPVPTPATAAASSPPPAMGAARIKPNRAAASTTAPTSPPPAVWTPSEPAGSPEFVSAPTSADRLAVGARAREPATSPTPGSMARMAGASSPSAVAIEVENGKEGPKRRKRALWLLLLLLLLATGGIVGALIGGGKPKGALGRGGSGSWTLNFHAHGELLNAPDWHLADSLWGAHGGLQWFRPANARLHRGSLVLVAKLTDSVPLPDDRRPHGRMGPASVLGCGRTEPSEALSPCVTTELVQLQLGERCARDLLAGSCNATAGVALPKSKAPPSILPPVASALFHAGEEKAGGAGVVTHGVLEMRVRLPIGDWLRPFIHLIPAPLATAAIDLAPAASSSSVDVASGSSSSGAASRAPQQLADGLDLRAIRLLDSRGNLGCSPGPSGGFKDGLSARSLSARVEWGPSASAGKLGARTAAALFTRAAADAADAAEQQHEQRELPPLGQSWLTLGLNRTARRLHTYLRDEEDKGRVHTLLLLELETEAAEEGKAEKGGKRSVCIAVRDGERSCQPLPPLPPDDASQSAANADAPPQQQERQQLNGLFDMPLALVVGLAVGSGAPVSDPTLTAFGAGAEMGGGECAKPWKDESTDAAARFYAHAADIVESWQQPQLEVAWIRFDAEEDTTEHAAAAGGAAGAGGRGILGLEVGYAGGRAGGGGGGGSGKDNAEVSIDDLSPTELAVQVDAPVAPEVLSEDEAHVCRMCTGHRCSITLDRSCAVRNGNYVNADPTAAERWDCLCSCCSSQCGISKSCAASPPEPASPITSSSGRRRGE